MVYRGIINDLSVAQMYGLHMCMGAVDVLHMKVRP
jgi:hypothetical protein